MADNSMTLYNYEKKLTNSATVTITAKDIVNRVATDDIKITITSDTKSADSYTYTLSSSLDMTNIGDSSRKYNNDIFSIYLASNPSQSKKTTETPCTSYKNKWGGKLTFTYKLTLSNSTFNTKTYWNPIRLTGWSIVDINGTNFRMQGNLDYAGCGPHNVNSGCFIVENWGSNAATEMRFNAQSSDGTGNWLFEDSDGHAFESVNGTINQVPIRLADVKKIYNYNGTYTDIFEIETVVVMSDTENTSQSGSSWNSSWKVAFFYIQGYSEVVSYTHMYTNNMRIAVKSGQSLPGAFVNLDPILQPY